ncbi:hypothetical protein G6F31_011104 [Rhizopus arrhizus]|nr:hypothetical protein G6F31_011104 [Rhizopus arrhizus]
MSPAVVLSPRPLALAVAALLAGSALTAQAETDATDIDTVHVTASQIARQALGTSTITAEAIATRAPANDIADLLRMHLGDEGYDVAHAASGDAGLRLLEQDGPWDALVLDVMLPGVDGLQVCQRARAMARYVPIIIISARGSETQRIVGLELGADDYLAKPFSMPELVARVRALLRRAEAMAQSARIDAGAIELGGLQLDPVARTASVEGTALELTPREFDLLLFFARHPDQVFARMELLNQVWGYQHDGYEHTVNTHINRLRSKIETDPANPRRLLTVWGRGYKLVDPAGAAA